jgi:molecular chaperone HscB
MSSLNFKQNFFQLFDLPMAYAVDAVLLGERYRQLQGELHPDRYASASDHEQRLAVQYSAMVNEAYATLRKPLARALYLLQLSGLADTDISGQQIDGSFLIMQMELREKLESLPSLAEPDSVLEHVVEEITRDIAQQQQQFSQSYGAQDLSQAAVACVKMQYLEKLLLEAEQIETDLMDN